MDSRCAVWRNEKSSCGSVEYRAKIRSTNTSHRTRAVLRGNEKRYVRTPAKNACHFYGNDLQCVYQTLKSLYSKPASHVNAILTVADKVNPPWR